jgi:DNA-binding HxlR family transcriptional regulator
VEAALRFIDGKWKGVVLWHLIAETLRFNLTERRRALAPPLLALKAWEDALGEVEEGVVEAA